MPYKDRGRWRSDIQINGKRMPSRSFETKREALEYESLLRKQSQKDCTDMALSELVVKYLDYCQLQFMPATYTLKRGIMARLLEGVESSTQVTRLTRAIMYEYLADQANIRASSKANEDRKHINAMFNWAQFTYDLQYNPVAGIRKFKAEGLELYTPPQEDVLKVVAAATGEAKVFLDCYLYTGAREQEVNRLRWKDIDHGQMKICLWSRKTKSRLLEPQWIDMAPQLSESLLWWKANKDHDSDHVFVNTQKGSAHFGKPYKNRNKLLTSLCKAAGVKRFGFHAMRRYVGSILAQHGVPMKVIQGVLRHKQLAHTEKYVRGLGIDMSSAIRTLEQSMAPEAPTQVPTQLRLVK